MLQSSIDPVDEALTVAQQIAEALDAAGQQGLVHRELKPGNNVTWLRQRDIFSLS